MALRRAGRNPDAALDRMDELLLDLLTGLSEFLRYVSGEAAKRQRNAGGSFRACAL